MNILTWRYTLAVIGLAAACFVTGYMGLIFSYDSTYSTVFWPPAGIALAAVLLMGYRIWPGIVLGLILLAAAFELPLPSIASIALGGALSPVIGAWMLKHWTRFDVRLHSIADVLLLVLLGGMVPAALNATLATLGLLFSGTIESLADSQWLLRWMGDTAGVLLVTPLLLLLGKEQALPSQASIVEGMVALLLLAVACAAGIGSWSPLSDNGRLLIAFAPAVFLIWVGVRLHLRWTAIAILIVASISMAGTALGRGPFVREAAIESLTLLWTFLAIVALMELLFGVWVSAQRRVRDQFRLIVEANPNAILLMDSSGRITQVNHRCTPIFGYEPGELINQSIDMLLPTDLVTRHARHRAGFMTSPKARPMGIGQDLLARRKDGTEVAVEVGLATLTLGNDVATLATVSDITERKLAQEALRQERNFISAVLDTTDSLVLVLDAQTRVVRFNKACERVSGYSIDEVKGRRFDELGLIPADEQPAVQSVIEQLKNGGQSSVMENHWLNRTGGRHLILWSNTVIRGADGSVEYLIGTGIDITERRQAEQDLQQWQARLAHMDRLAMASEMASGLAHELNQPLTAIMNYCDVALATVEAMPEQPDDLAHILNQASQQAQRAGAIINHLRNFVRKAGVDKEWTDLNVLIRHTLEFVGADISNRNVSIRLALTEPLPQLLLHQVLIEQVLVNLLRNACEAMASVQSDAPEIRISTTLTETGAVQVGVGDTGPGLEADWHQHVFKPFETSKPGGLGMGLAISRSIVEAQGGRLWTDPQAKDGAQFYFTLPVGKQVTA